MARLEKAVIMQLMRCLVMIVFIKAMVIFAGNYTI
jgi:hypothetical protein